LELEGFYWKLWLAGKGREISSAPVGIVKAGRLLDFSRPAPPEWRVGMPWSQARAGAPGAQRVEWAAIRHLPMEEFWKACSEVDPAVESFRPHSAFLGLGCHRKGEEVVARLAELVVPRLGHHLWAGLARGKFAARAVLLAYRGGAGEDRGISRKSSHTIVRLPEERQEEFLHELPLEWVWFLDEREKEILRRLGIFRLGEILAMDPVERRFWLGKRAEFFKALAEGIDPLPLRITYPPSRWERECEFDPPATSLVPLRARLEEWATSLASFLDEEGKGCRRLLLEAWGGEGRNWVAMREFSAPRGGCGMLRVVLAGLLEKMGVGAPVAGMRLRADCLEGRSADQLALWGTGHPRAGRRVPEDPSTLHPRLRRGVRATRRERLLEFWDPCRKRRVIS